jgi:acetyl/propionyl-CoA carboxylase alpha subunit
VKVLVANRGEIACRILKTLREMEIASVAVYSDGDRDAPHLDLADEAAPLGAPGGYLDPGLLIEAARGRGASAVHPGYGFLSQSADFAEACRAAGLDFIGPSPESMRLLGDKRSARRAAEGCGLPVVPGSSACDTLEAARRAVAAIGFPVLLKAAGGGGGRGMRLVADEKDLAEAYAAASREAGAAFADTRLLMEKYLAPARHVEAQILGDGRDAVALGERECSLQRRYQKIIEEAPSPGISGTARRDLLDAAVRLARHAGYRSAGTVEFLVGPDGAWHFLEVNTRLQVEHPVTELLTGIDIVAAQIDLARGRGLPEAAPPRGHAIEARLNAEDPHRGFLPSSGPILLLEWPSRPGVRIDSGIRQGQEVRPDYDPLLAKVIAWGSSREQARRRLVEALRGLTLLGVATNQAFLIQVLESDDFRRGQTYTSTIEACRWPDPEVPPEAVAAARQALQTPPAAENGGDRSGDRHSPWLAPDGSGRLRP